MSDIRKADGKSHMVEGICLRGKLDMNAAADLHGQLLVAAERDVRVDLGDVTLFGALAVQTCLAAARTAARNGRSFKIINTPDPVHEQLTHMGLTPEMLSEGHT